MALKFLNKKGWHTGSLRNIETVWKAEQKHGAEQKKLEELRKQIQEERERSEFRLLQEQAGLVPKQERLDFLYESGLAVGKTSEGFKALAAPPAPAESTAAEPSSSKAATAAAVVPGALFEDKPQSANDAWRKLHSDPLLLIRQREKEAVDRIKNNPMKMAMIKKSVETEKKHKRDRRKDKGEKKTNGKRKHKKSKRKKHSTKASSDSEGISGDEEERRKTAHSTHGRHHYSSSKREKPSFDITADLVEERKTSRTRPDSRSTNGGEKERRKDDDTRRSKHREEERRSEHWEEERRKSDDTRSEHRETQASKSKESYNRRRGVPKLSEEERAARLREMQMDAELHEEQRWKRLKKADEADVREAVRAASSSSAGGKNFLDAAKASIYGAEKGGSSTIEESLRRRAYYSQGSAAHESNAFRR